MIMMINNPPGCLSNPCFNRSCLWPFIWSHKNHHFLTVHVKASQVFLEILGAHVYSISTKPQRRPLFSSRFVLHESGSRELAQSWQVKFSQGHCQYIDIPPGQTLAQSFMGGWSPWLCSGFIQDCFRVYLGWFRFSFGLFRIYLGFV